MIDLVKLTGRPKNKLVQLALDLGKVKLDKLKWPMLWSEKLDGVFCLALKHTDKITIFSRTGEVFTSMLHIEQELSKVLNNTEIIIFEAYSYATKDQATISGWCRDTKQQHPELMAVCHTFTTIYELTNGGNVPFSSSYAALKLRLNRERLDKRIVTFLSQQYVNSFAEVMSLTQIVWDYGGEGGILRNPQALYAPGKRNQDIIKIKKGVSFDLKVLNVYEGKGKYQGNLGGLVCQWKEGKTIEISGMTDAQRKEWWSNPQAIIGKIVQVDAMCESSKGLLREPRFKGIRYDKTEGDF